MFLFGLSMSGAASCLGSRHALIPLYAPCAWATMLVSSGSTFSGIPQPSGCQLCWVGLLHSALAAVGICFKQLAFP